MTPCKSNRLLFAALLCVFSTLSASAADRNRKVTDKPPEVTDSDKRKLAEIEQRADVKALIARRWVTQQLDDQNYISTVNSTEGMAAKAGYEYATFLQSYYQLYNNPMLQRYFNAIGQQLVPKESPNTYSFKLVLDPIPLAESYSTGTVLVSTGLVSMLDNEAQLAYVLGHEIAHVEKKHLYEAIRREVLETELNKEKEADAAKKRAVIAAIASAAGAGIGGLAGGGNGAVLGAFAGFGGGLITSAFIVRDRVTHTEWPDIYENDADKASLQYNLNQGYDVRESLRLYARLDKVVGRDHRIGLGFIADPDRMRSRAAHIDTLLAGEMKDSVSARLKGAGLTGSSGNFALLMAALKRDNGVIAMQYDLFDMARDNLEEAVSLRGNDSRAQLYLGKVISLTARNDADRQVAEQHFLKAIEYDETRGAYPEPHLEHALHLLGAGGDKEETRREIEAYIALYQREHAGTLPANMHILYDYLTLTGDTRWYAAPAAVVSTKYVEPVHTSIAGALPMSGSDVVAAATGTAAAKPAAMEAIAPPKPVTLRRAKTHP